jgi:hypothetical protein
MLFHSYISHPYYILLSQCVQFAFLHSVDSGNGLLLFYADKDFDHEVHMHTAGVGSILFRPMCMPSTEMHPPPLPPPAAPI